MAEITTSPVTTHDVKNYTGVLFRTTPEQTPLTTMIGGLRGGRPVFSREWTWQTEDNDDAAQDGALEGADPTYTARDRSEVTQVLQVFQYGVNIAYSAMGAVDQLASDAQNILGDQPVQDEVVHQLALKLVEAKRDLEFSVLRGSYVNPSNNSSSRKMRGMENAISTNSIDASSAAVAAATFDVTGGTVDDVWTITAHLWVTGDEVQFTAVGTGAEGFTINTVYFVIRTGANEFQLASTLDNALAGTQVEGTSADSSGTWTLRKSNRNTKALINKLVRQMATGTTNNDGAPFTMPVLFAGAFNKTRLSNIYGYAPESRTVGGLNLQQLEIDLIGSVPIVFDRFMPDDKIFIIDMSFLQLRAMPIKNRGVFFFEPRADTGASEHYQLYGEIGVQYGPEEFHGAITGLTTDEQVT